jgi:hypothetical protein
MEFLKKIRGYEACISQIIHTLKEKFKRLATYPKGDSRNTKTTQQKKIV